MGAEEGTEEEDDFESDQCWRALVCSLGFGLWVVGRVMWGVGCGV